MKAIDAARTAGVSVRALRYYERLGLIQPARSANRYRDYQPMDVLCVQEIKTLTALGLGVAETRPFLDCLRAGNTRSDVCPESLATYRHAINELSRRIETLSDRRLRLSAYLAEAVATVPDSLSGLCDVPPFSVAGAASPRLIVSADDAEIVDRVTGCTVPALTFGTIHGLRMALTAGGPGRTVLYVYPLTGQPGVDLPTGWDTIPGARGCTAEAEGFRDHFTQLREAGAVQVFGLSSQSTTYQQELVHRLRLPFDMLSDPDLTLARALGLPTFAVEGQHLYRRLTLILRAGTVEQVFYPVAQPERHAEEVVAWLIQHRSV